MDWKVFGTAFMTIFLAELGDKTQLTVFAMSASTRKPAMILLGSVLALTLSSVLAVAVGESLGSALPAKLISRLAALMFVGTGVFLWFKAV